MCHESAKESKCFFIHYLVVITYKENTIPRNHECNYFSCQVPSLTINFQVNCCNSGLQASIVRNKKDTIHTKSERHILEAVKVCL